MNEIIYLLEVFEGKVSLTDILNYSIPFINSLKHSKIELREAARKESEKNNRQSVSQQPSQKQKTVKSQQKKKRGEKKWH